MSLNPQPRLANDGINEMASEHCQSEPVVHHTGDELKSDSISHESRLSIYFTLDSAGVVLAVNPVGAAALGYTVEELIEQSIFSFFHWEDRAKLHVEFIAFVQHPAQVLKEKFRLLSKDGSSRLVKITAQALQGTAANTVSWHGNR
jgi:PAS domain S-box-containing protein